MHPTEHQIQTAILQYLKAKGWYSMRLNSGRYSVGEGRSKRFIMGQEKGTPDIMAFRNDGETELIFIEVKRPGNRPTIHQIEKMKELESYGAYCMVATSVEDLEEAGI